MPRSAKKAAVRARYLPRLLLREVSLVLGIIDMPYLLHVLRAEGIGGVDIEAGELVPHRARKHNCRFD